MTDPLAHLRRDVTRQAVKLLAVAEKHDAGLRTVAEGARDPAIRRSLVEASRHLGAFMLGIRGLLLVHGLLEPTSGTTTRAAAPAHPKPAALST